VPDTNAPACRRARNDHGNALSLDENDDRGNAREDAPALVPLPTPWPGIRLWWCDLRADATTLRRCEALLSEAEHARGARFGTRALRDRYVVGRASLRIVLGEMLGVAPERVPIVRGLRGRPTLGNGARLDFNVSHTADVALLGVFEGVARIGVDVERSDRIVNVAGLARKFLTERERAALGMLDADGMRRRVLTLWTCKEAMSKATGDALSAPFSRLDVDLRGGPRLVDGPAPYQPSCFELRKAAVPAGHIGTVALWRPADGNAVRG
jgi:4'-phosphopantetheinyl transferase